MSSEMIGVGAIGAILLAPPAIIAGAALGTGWVAWQAGKLALGAVGAMHDQTVHNQRLQQEREKQQRTAALAAHRQMVDMCKGVLSQLDSLPAADQAQVDTLRRELKQLCQEPVPQDTARIEQMNARGLMALERITDRASRLKQLKLDSSADYAGFSLSDLMDDLRLAVSTVQVTQTNGSNVTAPDARAMERAALNQKLAEVSARIMDALAFIVDLEQNYGISTSNNAWFHACFSDVDETITTLCSPRTSNASLKQGIRSLEENMQLFDRYLPTLRREQAALDQLYPIYLEAAKALCEQPHSLRHFRSADALNAEMHRLEKRAQRAAECARLYQALGPEAYLCYAWDQELTAMGYNVCSRKKITQMVTGKPQYAEIDGTRIPFYEWSDDALTQIYEVSPECRMQIIVHPDGTTTMETITVPADPAAITALQKKHCQQMRQAQQRLRENWFIIHGLEETSSPETIHSLQAWQSQDRNPWVQIPEEIPGVQEQTDTRTATPQQQALHMD